MDFKDIESKFNRNEVAGLSKTDLEHLLTAIALCRANDGFKVDKLAAYQSCVEALLQVRVSEALTEKTNRSQRWANFIAALALTVLLAQVTISPLLELKRSEKSGQSILPPSEPDKSSEIPQSVSDPGNGGKVD